MSVLRWVHNRFFSSFDGGWRNSAQLYQQKVRETLSARLIAAVPGCERGLVVITENGDRTYFFRNKLETWEKIPQYIKSAACISTECHISPSGYLLISRTLCTDCTSKTVDTYGLGEFCRSGTKVDDLFVLHVQIWDVASVRMLAAALTLSLGRISALRQASEMLIVWPERTRSKWLELSPTVFRVRVISNINY